ncbi:hypothetical protein [Metapseudomonas sp. CR1201]
MKILRNGRYRNDGSDTIADSKMKVSLDGEGTFLASLTGKDRGNNYRYRVIISHEELLEMLTHQVLQVAETKADKAVGLAAVESIRVLLDVE